MVYNDVPVRICFVFSLFVSMPKEEWEEDGSGAGSATEMGEKKMHQPRISQDIFLMQFYVLLFVLYVRLDLGGCHIQYTYSRHSEPVSLCKQIAA